MWEILGGLLVGTAVSGIVPFVNAELLVVVAAATVPVMAIPLVACASTLGQMSSKTSLFALARWAPSRLPARPRAALDRAAAVVSERNGAAGSLVFTSALTGLPPFYGVSLASGAVGMRLWSFVLCGSAGRLVRFSVLAWAGGHFGPKALELISDGTSVIALLSGAL
jgi:membrane protein YqaA with SNARE-associated domain